MLACLEVQSWGGSGKAQLRSQTTLICIQKQMETGDQFRMHFNDFIQLYTCASHPTHSPTFVCVDSNCRSHGLICSLCLTINNAHKGHDSVQIYQFIQRMNEHYCRQSEVRSDRNQLVDRIVESYEGLLKSLSQFHERLSGLIKDFITSKSNQHLRKQNSLFEELILERLKSCSYDSIEAFNEGLSALIDRLDPQTLKPTQSGLSRSTSELQNYLQDLEYQRQTINSELQRITEYLSGSLLASRQVSPVVIPVQKTFSQNITTIQKQEYYYIGDVKNGRPHGRGVIHYKNAGKIVQGCFRNGHIQGRGVLYFRNGDIYLGDFHEDKKQGRGIYVWTDPKSEALRYTGQFKNSKRCGRGLFQWNDGSKYQGEFINGVQAGFGVLYRGNGTREYQGQWENGVFSGRGVQSFENGEEYEGEFKNDKFHGSGVFRKSDSVVFGEWKDNDLVKVSHIKQLRSQ